jgi:putative lipoprotein
MSPPATHFASRGGQSLRLFGLCLVASAGVFAGGLALGAESSQGMITGTVSYFQRMALAPDALIAVSLQDVTLADAPSKLIVEQRFPAAGRQVPISFRLPYEPASIDSTHRYTLRATITTRGKLTFSTTTVYPVLTAGAPRNVDLVLQPVPGSARPTASAAARLGGPATLDKTYWKLTELGGAPLAASGGKREAHLIFRAANHHVAGTSGCNRLFGTFETGPDQALKLKLSGMTMMACPEPLMTQERNLLDALGAVTNYRLDGEKLELRKGEQVMARFEARAPK